MFSAESIRTSEMQVQERTVARVSKNFLRAIVDPAEPNVEYVFQY